MGNTYWNNKGKFSPKTELLDKLIPDEGEVKGRSNKALERYRKACNLYYEIFNNGCCNRSAGAKRLFNIDGPRLKTFCRSRNWDTIHSYTEPAMDNIIEKALIEQKIYY